MSVTRTVPVNSITLSSPQGKDSLSRARHTKTLDIGSNGSTLSANDLGDLLQLSCFHPVHGIVVACPFAQFDGDRFYDSEYVRDYRTRLMDYVRKDEPGFGIRFTGNPTNLNVRLIDGRRILVTYSIGDVEVEKTVFIDEAGYVVQSSTLSTTSNRPVELGYTLAINVSVNRASYGQLTEGGPLPIPSPRNELKLLDDGSAWSIVNPNLDAMVQGTLCCDGKALDLRLGMKYHECVSLEDPVSAEYRGTLLIAPRKPSTLVSTFHLRAGIEHSKPIKLTTTVPYLQENIWNVESEAMRQILQGNLFYILNNCTIPIDEGSSCFIADHVALPLGWNRDNYWQIRYLLDIHQNIDRLMGQPHAHKYGSQIQTAVHNHLVWVFTRAKRPHGYWHRSYLTTGVPKDGPVFQQDQQCYPILELCDFYERFPSEIDFTKSILAQDVIPTILSVLTSHQDRSTGLYMTEETPGDDAVDHPFHFSSHVLLWYTLTRLSGLLSTLGFRPESFKSIDLEQQASDLRIATLKYFTAINPTTGTSMFAYLTDGAGIHTFYHDANDIPTLFLPTWNFALPSTPEYTLWLNTMEFGLSSSNKEGFFPEGLYGGLGSVHTRGPWPLGFAQELTYANMKDDGDAARDAWRRIQGCMFWDGMFSEAIDSRTGDCTSKAWFSWPGSMIGSALLKYGVPLSR